MISIVEFRRRLRDTADGGLRREIRAALEPLARESEREAKRLASTRLRVRTGRLVRSIRGEVTEELDRPRLQLSADTPYAGYLERGTRQIRARHYLRDAIRRIQPQLPGAVLEATRAALLGGR